ncbi:hypothetical protein B6N60_04652 [Richelia sinica FACHB-800]|uniref:Uncharacterized protein n=1 Tax=Richelia sinica FACHB-800 TaxID=1357546 RepID=A0A975TBY6_9NOST|nr:hypothetical protein B6N60_04652 [Richelia sinica FACHB-800]
MLVAFIPINTTTRVNREKRNYWALLKRNMNHESLDP